MQQAVDTLDLSPYVTSSDLQTALHQQTEASEKSLQSSTEALDRRVDSLDGELGKLTEQIQELQVSKNSALSHQGYTFPHVFNSHSSFSFLFLSLSPSLSFSIILLSSLLSPPLALVHKGQHFRPGFTDAQGGLGRGC